MGVGRSACVSVFGEPESSFLMTYRSGLKMAEKLHVGPVQAFRPTVWTVGSPGSAQLSSLSIYLSLCIFFYRCPKSLGAGPLSPSAVPTLTTTVFRIPDSKSALGRLFSGKIHSLPLSWLMARFASKFHGLKGVYFFCELLEPSESPDASGLARYQDKALVILARLLNE